MNPEMPETSSTCYGLTQTQERPSRAVIERRRRRRRQWLRAVRAERRVAG